ncbi:MAG: methyltransferase domain-containing protein [Chloroflexi bacterium]|nr:methyltransferase domain-containing protein [Chloroflexota bacterium]
MSAEDEGRKGSFRRAEFPRSENYDPDWVLDNMMGPNALWLTESLAACMNLSPGMRVLDMGCGRGLSSIFLAKEYGLQVWATDLWIDAGENLDRIREAGLEDSVFPIHAEAHVLPFADGFFDAMVSVDAYHYFGTDDLYLQHHMARLVRPGGQMGIVVPGLVEELTSDEPPEHLRSYWQPELFSLHSPAWWKRHWERSGLVSVERADLVPDGWRLWVASDVLWSERLGKPADEADMLAVDSGRVLGFTRMVARRNDRPTGRLDEL